MSQQRPPSDIYFPLLPLCGQVLNTNCTHLLIQTKVLEQDRNKHSGVLRTPDSLLAGHNSFMLNSFCAISTGEDAAQDSRMLCERWSAVMSIA